MFQEDNPRARGAQPASEDVMSNERPIGIMQYRIACADTCVWIYRDRSGQLWQEGGDSVRLPPGYMQAP